MRKLVIEKAAIRANMAVVRKRAAGAALYGVLTGDGGGTGLIPLARMLRTRGWAALPWAAWRRPRSCGRPALWTRRSSCYTYIYWTGRSWSGWWT